MSGIGRQFLVNTNLINVCLFLLPICVGNDEEEIIKYLKDIKDDDDDDNDHGDSDSEEKIMKTLERQSGASLKLKIMIIMTMRIIIMIMIEREIYNQATDHDDEKR